MTSWNKERFKGNGKEDRRGRCWWVSFTQEVFQTQGAD